MAYDLACLLIQVEASLHNSDLKTCPGQIPVQIISFCFTVTLCFCRSIMPAWICKMPGWIFSCWSVFLNQVRFHVVCATNFQWTFKWNWLYLHKCLENVISLYNLSSLRQPIFMDPVTVLGGCWMLISLDFDLMWGFVHSCLVFEKQNKVKKPWEQWFPRHCC